MIRHRNRDICNVLRRLRPSPASIAGGCDVEQRDASLVIAAPLPA
jgi:hypothetical protein